MTKSALTSILDRVRSELRLKIILLGMLNLAVWVPYQFLQRVHFFPATSMPLSWIDDVVPFSPGAVWAYISIYVFLPLGPFLLVDKNRILRYAHGVLAMTALATIIFIFWPSVCPRPDASGANAAYRALISVDNPYHAFPSLHAAFAIYSALYAIEAAQELGWPRASHFGFYLWAGIILYATLATRQHVFSDIVAGSFLGFGAYQLFSFRLQTVRLPRPIKYYHED